MKLMERTQKIRGRQQMAGTWSASSEAESRYFDACCEVLESARTLERMGSSLLSPGASAASLGCLAAALDSLANSSLMAGESSFEACEESPSGRLLHGVSQNLRLASYGCERGRETLEAASTRS